MEPLRAPRADFDPEPHRAALCAIVDAVLAASELDARALDRIVRRHPMPDGGLFSKTAIIAGFRAFARGDDSDEDDFVRRLRMRPVRTLSGVTPVTVLTKPFPCPGTCIFCPNDVRMPKSYLSDEPGAQRAAQNRFDPYLQTWNRLAAFDATGHPVDKIELIVLGGTWSFHPEAYQVYFVSRSLEAMNDFGAGRDGRSERTFSLPDFEAIVGVSLGGTCVMRLRPYKPGERQDRRNVIAITLEPRSAYCMRGPARWGWQHCIVATKELRYSITLRTARSRHA